jgi:glucose-6-phosphate 1-dehydrogenase
MRTLVIFGATGDLAGRMLFPSLYFLERDGLLPKDLRVIGSSRGEMADEAFIALVRKAVEARADGQFEAEPWGRLEARLRYVSAEADRPKSFDDLALALKGDEETVFFLATSPTLFVPIAEALGRCGAAIPTSRIVLEKPIGRDLASCQAINDAVGAVFSERRIFRIDHYLGKEAVQNLLALRFANTLFEPLWNKVSIDHVQITVAETVGVEGRFSYYNDYGAIRDMVQNHVLQLLCLVAMEPPASLDPDSVRNEKVKVLRSLRPIAGPELSKRTVRGQYGKGVAEGRTVPGYVQEEGAHPSHTETFVALQANIDNWRWAGVPFYLRTGKRMAERASQIVLQFRAVPHSIFPGQDLLANRLVIRLQPEEEISMTLMNKTPSLTQAGGMQLAPLSLDLSLDNAFPGQPRRRIAYERLLLEALNDNPTLFVRRDEAEAAWVWIDGIVQGWSAQAMAPSTYPAGSWGPAGAFALTERNGQSWMD